MRAQPGRSCYVVVGHKYVATSTLGQRPLLATCGGGDLTTEPSIDVLVLRRRWRLFVEVMIPVRPAAERSVLAPAAAAKREVLT